MDCSENENVCSVKKENNLGYYRIHTIWNNNGFRINIASRDGAWTGQMKPENVQNISRDLKVDPEKYLAECKEVLTTDGGMNGYFYAVENGSFTWKKMIDEDSGIKIRMGSVMIQPVSFVETIQNIVEVALNCKKNLHRELNSIRQEKETDLQRISLLQGKFEELYDKKNLMETNLYSKFLLLLNSKKRKIQDLEESVVGWKESSEKLEKCSHSRYNRNLVEEINITEAYDMDTEDEFEHSCEEKRNIELCHKMPFDSAKEKAADAILREEGCSNNNKCEKGHIASKVCSESDVHSSESTPSFDVPCGNSSIPGTSSPNSSSDNFEIRKDKSKSLPATKAELLDFFFGVND